MSLLTSLNRRARQLCQSAKENQSALGVRVSEMQSKANVLDFGSDRAGTLAGGVLLARICMSDLAEVDIIDGNFDGSLGLKAVRVATRHPLEACIASQYAGWPFLTESYFAICSGPARISRGKEEILIQHHLVAKSQELVGVFETDKLPDDDAVGFFAEECGSSPNHVTLCVAKTSSIPGTTQVVARSVETAMHKLHELGVDLRCIQRGEGIAPLPPVGKDDYQSLGWTNDAILYGGDVRLWINAGDIDLADLVLRIPSCSSAEFGEPFISIFEKYDRNFFAIDPMLFSPAKITLIDKDSGKSFVAGKTMHNILRDSFERV